MALFGSSGIRRIADRSLLELAQKTGLALGKYREVVVGYDTRTSSPAVKHALFSGLLMGGVKAFDAGVMPTPTVAWAARKFRVGVMITASHNPPEYNGLKLFNPDGSAFDSEQQAEIESLMINSSASPWSEFKSEIIYNNGIEEHIEHIVKNMPVSKVKVVLDCDCGAASVITPYLLKKMGCEVIAMNCNPSGFFPHPVEPVEANLSDLIRATREFSADVGIVHDGDADRMMAVDDRGRFISGDKLLTIFARDVKAKELVTTLDASMVIEEMGFNVTRTRVGDTFVSDRLKRGGDFGGEPSGSWVFPENSLCPDGIYAAAHLVRIASQHKISEIVDSIPEYPIIRASLPARNIDMTRLEKRLLLAIAPLSVSSIDGLKLNFADGWLLVRSSGTEPRIRITAEARAEDRVRYLYRQATQAIEDITG